MKEWERSVIDAHDGLTGERLILRDNNEAAVGVVVVWPGCQTRIFWAGGRITDIGGRDSRSRAIAAVEKEAGL